jgi:hypothetical protein
MLRQPIQIETGGVVSGGEALGDAQAVERVAAQGVGVEEVVQVSVADGSGGVGPAEDGAVVGGGPGEYSIKGHTQMAAEFAYVPCWRPDGKRFDCVVHQRGHHPIHAGFPAAWRAADMEVYYYARGPAENVEVLAFATEPKTTMSWPIEWTVTYGSGRVFVSTYGHVWKGDTQPVAMRCAAMQTIMIRAVQWLAGKPVTYPIPADFPSAEHASIRGPIPVTP